MNLRKWLSTVADVNLRPTEFFENVDGDRFDNPVKFAALTGLVFGGLLSALILISSVFSQNSAFSAIGISILLLIAVPVSLILSTFFQSALVHIAVYLFGKRGFEKTYNAVSYPVVAVSVWGWIPILNIVAGIYSLYIQAKGVEELHDMDFGKALISASWPLLLWIIIVMLLVVVALVGAFTMPVESFNSTA